MTNFQARVLDTFSIGSFPLGIQNGVRTPKPMRTRLANSDAPAGPLGQVAPGGGTG